MNKQFIMGMVQGMLGIIFGWICFFSEFGNLSDKSMLLSSIFLTMPSFLLFAYSRNIEKKKEKQKMFIELKGGQGK